MIQLAKEATYLHVARATEKSLPSDPVIHFLGIYHSRERKAISKMVPAPELSPQHTAPAVATSHPECGRLETSSGRATSGGDAIHLWGTLGRQTVRIN